MGLQYDNFNDDVEQPINFHCETIAKSKLNHRCTECRGIIEKGQSYEKSSGIWDGRWSTYRKCKFCMDFESAFEFHYRGFMHSSAFGEMLADARESMRDLFSESHPGRWYSVAKKYVVIKRNYYSQLKRGVVDKSDRGIPRGPHKFWHSIRHERIWAELKKEEDETRTQKTLG